MFLVKGQGIGGNPCRRVRRAQWSQDVLWAWREVKAAEEVGRQLRPAQSNRLATSHSELNFKITTPMGVWLRCQELLRVCA